MSAQRAIPYVLFLVVIWTRGISAGQLELRLGQVHESSFSSGQAQSFVVSLAEGDFAQIAMNPRGQVVIVKTYDPRGKPFRGAELGPEEDRLNFVAEGAGAYGVEVSAKDKHASGTYTLIEPIPGDRENMAVTFLFQGTGDTHNVLVLWLPYVGVAPDEFLMERVGDSDVWYKTIKVNRKMRLAYTLAPNAARLRPMSLGFDNDAITMTAAAARPDPLNPKRYRIDAESVDAPEFRGNSVLEMPDAPPQPWILPRPGIPAGRVLKFPFKSASLNNEREIAVYLPTQYSPQTEPPPLIMLFDEDAYLSLIPTPTILDNLISEKRIPPVVALLVGNAPGDARDRELACNPEFDRALVNELLPWAHRQFNFTNDPRRTVIGGSSRGGLAAACAGLWYPETFGNVLAQSGSFHIIPSSSGEASDSGSEPNWLARRFISSPKKPLRFYLDTGSAEFNATGSADSILFCTRTLRDVLRAKGYEVQFQEFEGGHDYLSWRGTLADGLIALLGGGAAQ